jgi:mannose-6-phosphate isomerase-like protein (cupin superfamily)
MGIKSPMADERFRVLAFDDVEEVPWNAGMTMRPIRGRLGLRAFGASGFRGADRGDLVVEPHTEANGRGHEELYVVLRGHARFRLDGEDVEAPAGTLVFVKDPAVHREAVAVLADTAILALGGPPTFTPAGHEYMARVRALTADPEQARHVAEAGLRELPKSPGVRYALALAAAAAGDRDEARRRLAEATEHIPELRAEALDEPLLRDLVDD